MVSKPIKYVTLGGIEISRTSEPADYASAISEMLDRVDNRLGAVLSSNYEYPGRYTRWDTAIVDPPISIQSQARNLTIQAHNERGRILLGAIATCCLLYTSPSPRDG